MSNIEYCWVLVYTIDKQSEPMFASTDEDIARAKREELKDWDIEIFRVPFKAKERES